MVRAVEPQFALDELALLFGRVLRDHEVRWIAGRPGEGKHDQRNDKEEDDALQEPVEDVFLQIPDLKE